MAWCSAARGRRPSQQQHRLAQARALRALARLTSPNPYILRWYEIRTTRAPAFALSSGLVAPPNASFSPPWDTTVGGPRWMTWIGMEKARERAWIWGCQRLRAERAAVVRTGASRKSRWRPCHNPHPRPHHRSAAVLRCHNSPRARRPTRPSPPHGGSTRRTARASSARRPWRRACPRRRPREGRGGSRPGAGGGRSPRRGACGTGCLTGV